MRKTLFLLVMLLSTFVVSAKDKYVKLADMTEVKVADEDVKKIVEDLSFDIKLLEPLFEKERNRQASSDEMQFLYKYVFFFDDYYKTLFKKGTRLRSEQLLNTVKTRSQELLSYLMNSEKLVQLGIKRLPIQCDKQLALIHASSDASSVSTAQNNEDQTEDLKMIIKEQREQIEYLKKRLEDCESAK